MYLCITVLTLHAQYKIFWLKDHFISQIMAIIKYVCLFVCFFIVRNISLIMIVMTADLSHHLTKPTKWPVRPAKTQISLCICPVWSESSLSAWRNIGPFATYWAHSKDSDQTGRMPRLIWVFAVRICHFVGFVVRQLICSSPQTPVL